MTQTFHLTQSCKQCGNVTDQLGGCAFCKSVHGANLRILETFPVTARPVPFGAIVAFFILVALVFAGFSFCSNRDAIPATNKAVRTRK